MAMVNLNKLASELCGENTKVRIRVQDGEFQIRPTNRVEGKNLPKGEQLVELKSRADRGTRRFALPAGMEMQVTKMFRAEVRKSGWIGLVSLTQQEREALTGPVGKAQPAAASVTSK